MNKIIVALFLFLPISLAAQTSKYYVGLENGDVINGNQVRFKSPMFGRDHILIDDHNRFELDEVAYYQNEDGYFKKFTPPGWPKEAFFKREVEGERIEVYSKLGSYTSYRPVGGIGTTGMGVGMSMTPNYNFVRHDYYTKDNADPLTMSFANLNKDLADNPMSMDVLKKVRTLRTVTAILYVVGAAFTLAGISETFNHQSGDANQQIQISPFLIGGVVTLAIPNFLRSSKRKNMLAAVVAYNR